MSSAAPRASPTSSKSSAKKSTPRSTCGSAPTSSTAVATSRLYWRTPYQQEDSTGGGWGRVQRPELLGRTRQRRQRHGDRARRSLVCGGRKPDRRAPGIGSVHDGDHRLHGAAAAADRHRACSPRLKPRSRARYTATSRRSCRSSSRPCSPRNRSTSTSRSCTRVVTECPKTEVITMGTTGYPDTESGHRSRNAVPGQRRQRLHGPDRQLVVRVGYEPDRSKPRKRSVHHLHDQLHRRTAAADLPQLGIYGWAGDR